MTLSKRGPSSTVVRYSQAAMPTRLGRFTVVVYREPGREDKEHLAIVAGSLDFLTGSGVLARVHSECWTGETLGSLKCDCREQLDRALELISKEGRGVIVYLRQEGRGIGLGNKIRAYALQEHGADTVEANLELGFGVDLRSYELAAAILHDLDVSSVRLMTNNPDKVAGLEAAGIAVETRVPHLGSAQEHNRDYLAVKKTKLGHQI